MTTHIFTKISAFKFKLFCLLHNIVTYDNIMQQTKRKGKHNLQRKIETKD